jgi:hypothetical protein
MVAQVGAEYIVEASPRTVAQAAVASPVAAARMPLEEEPPLL